MSGNKTKFDASLFAAAAGFAVFAVLAAAPAQALPIAVANFSFETPDTATFSSGPITGWSESVPASSGVFQPSSNALSGLTFIAGVHTPLGGTGQTAYINSGFIFLDLTDTLAAGTYTLTVAIGDRADTPLPTTTIQIRAGTTNALATVIATGIRAADAGPTNQGWADLSASVTILAGDPLLGQGLWIDLINTGGGAQVNFDNVRLDFVATQAVPEPASLALLGLGLTALGLRRRKLQA